jgi:ribosomal protein L11 methyltransferase
MRTWPALEVGRLDEPDLFQAALLDFDVSAIDETTQPDAWRVFFGSDAARNAAAQQLSRQFPDTVIRLLDVPDEDWVARSQASLRAIRIGDLVVAPPWDVPGDGLVIVIRPSMGFGTGHHPTTRLCLLALQQADLRGRRVIDVGTGSGLLAIAASRLGAAHVVGIDDDPDAFHAAQDNLALNVGADVTLRHVDVRYSRPEPFDVLIANITGTLLHQIAPQVHDLTKPGASIILSGFMREEAAEVLEAYTTFATAMRTTEEEEWLCMTLRRQ